LGKAQDSNAIAAEPKAIVFYQAALLVDPRNFMAANELGVLLANYGKYDQAMAAFVQSLKVSPQPVTWQNLAVVHAQLGQTELAQRAMREAALAARRGVDQAPGPLGLSVKPYDIQWVDPGTFARVGESPAVADPRPGRPPVQKRAAAASTGVSPWH
jgi:tetratricopeptide (TPR) repeat protein